MSTPLAVLDLLPRSARDDRHQAVRNAVDLATVAERLGYARLWHAEHHLNPGVLGASPAVTLALVGHATESIRLGSAGVQIGHRTPLAIVEELGLLESAFPGRIDLGIGRSPGRPAPAPDTDGPGDRAAGVAAFLASRGSTAHDEDQHTESGLLLPRAFDPRTTYSSDRLAHTLDLLQQPGAWTPAFDDQVAEVLQLLGGPHVADTGHEARAYPGLGADLQVWLLGSTGGDSAAVAGARGLPFVASYHHSPSTVVDAVDAYRAAFAAAGHDHEPYVAVSADVVVAPTDDEARDLALGYGPWVLSIRTGRGAIPYPSTDDARQEVDAWTDADRELVHDRVRTQVVGSPDTVADVLERLRAATGADELAVTTSTYRHEDRVRSYELLADVWL